MKASELYDYMDSLAPFGTSENWDNAGLLVGSPERETGRVLVSLDVTPDTAAEAQRIGAGIILSHHPVIFHPLRSLPANGLYASLLRSDITVISAHTCLDFAAGGVNDVLAARLGLRSVLRRLRGIGGRSRGGAGSGGQHQQCAQQRTQCFLQHGNTDPFCKDTSFQR